MDRSHGAPASLLKKGAYVYKDYGVNDPELILIASGSEVELAVKAAEKLEGEGHAVRVVSMPSFDLFEAQPESYKEEVLPNSLRKRIAIEAGVSFGWSKYVGLDGIIVSVDGLWRLSTGKGSGRKVWSDS